MTSRRTFMKSAAALTVAGSSLGARNALGAGSEGRRFAYVGTYTEPGDSRGNGEGIYRFAMDAASGELSRREVVARSPNPSSVTIHPSKRYLYAVNEVANFEGNNGSLSGFALGDGSGPLEPLNVKSTEGAGPAYVSMEAAGKYAFVANYKGGSVAVLPVLAGGMLGTAVDVHRDTDSLGATRATDGPPGSFAISGHDTPHAHMILQDPSRRFVLTTDLGQDRIYVYRFDGATGKLTPIPDQCFISLPSGDGPRHLAFHPNGHWLYSIQEEASTVVFFHFDASSGHLTPQQTLSTLPAGFAGTSFASEILVSSDGRFVYAGNRLHNTIAVFSIDHDGKLALTGETSSFGDYPHQLAIAPGGRFLYACNLRSDSISTFRIDRKNGSLHFTGQYTAVGSPGSIAFVG
jgi:6-phosphogluconolactonase (cycloisomerase 2 family)